MITNGLPAPLNITLVSGVEKVVEMQVSEVNGAFRDMSYYTYSGVAEGVDGKVYEIAAWVSEESADVILMRFPALDEGRYKWALTAEAEDGTSSALVSGILGVQWPQIGVKKGVISSPNRRVVVRYPDDSKAGVARWVGTQWLDVTLEAALDAEKGAREAAGRLSVVDEKLQQAEALKEAFDDKISDAIVPDDVTGTWVVGGVDTGKPYKGADGADGQKIKRYVIDADYKLPSTGDGGTYYYVVNAFYNVYMRADRAIYLYVENPESHVDKVVLYINGTAFMYMGVSLVSWVDRINTDFATEVKAELVSMRWVKLTALYDGVQVQVAQTSGSPMFLQNYYGFAVYGWVNGRGWVNMDMARDLESLPIANAGAAGVVKLANSVIAADASKGEVPTGEAVISYVSGKIAGLASKSELTSLATKAEIADLASKSELEDFATEGYVDQAVSELGESTYSKAETEEQFVSKEEADETYIRKDAGYPAIQIISREAFDALPSRDPNVIYYIKK